MNSQDLENMLNDAFQAPGLSGTQDDAGKDPAGHEKIYNLLISNDFSSGGCALGLVRDACSQDYLDEKQLNCLYFVDLLFKQIDKSTVFHSEVASLIRDLKPLLYQLLINEPGFIRSSRHPVRQCLDEIFSALVGWEEGLGRNGENYLGLCEGVVAAMRDLKGNEENMPESVEDTFAALAKLCERLALLEKRLCETEDGAQKSLRAKHNVDKLLCREMTGKELPAQLIEFLLGRWQESLHLQLIKTDDWESNWPVLENLTKKLIFTLENSESETEIKQKQSLIPAMRNTLEKYLISTGGEEEKQDLLGSIESLHMDVLKGEEIERAPAPDISMAELDGVVTTVVPEVSEQAASLKPGDWFLFHSENGDDDKRLKVARIFIQSGQVMFVNLTGGGSLHKTWEELGYGLSSKQVELLPFEKTFTWFLTRAVKLFLNQYRNFTPAALEEVPLEEVAPEVAEDLMIDKEDDQPVNKEDHQRSLEKLRQEVEELERYQEELAAQPAKRFGKLEKAAPTMGDVNPYSEDDREGLVEYVNSFSIGTWMLLKDRIGEVIPCKLAAILKPDAVMVFVEKSGMRVGEYTAESLVDEVIKGNASFTSQNPGDASSMERLIQTMRQH